MFPMFIYNVCWKLFLLAIPARLIPHVPNVYNVCFLDVVGGCDQEVEEVQLSLGAAAALLLPVFVFLCFCGFVFLCLLNSFSNEWVSVIRKWRKCS